MDFYSRKAAVCVIGYTNNEPGGPRAYQDRFLRFTSKSHRVHVLIYIYRRRDFFLHTKKMIISGKRETFDENDEHWGC